MTVTIQIELPDDVYRALVPQAEQNGTQVHRLVSAAVARSVRGQAPRPEGTLKEQAQARGEAARNASVRIDAEIRELHAREWSDVRIAAELGLDQTSISARRRRMGLPQVGKPGRPRRAAA